MPAATALDQSHLEALAMQGQGGCGADGAGTDDGDVVGGRHCNSSKPIGTPTETSRAWLPLTLTLSRKGRGDWFAPS